MAARRRPDRSSVDDDVAALYAGDPADFLAGRQALIGAARSAGERDLARTLGGLRKPTRSAALVNRLAHERPEVVAELRAVAAELRSATAALDASALRSATTARRDLVARLTRDALGSATAGTAVRDEVAATFDAALADPEVAASLGRLERAAHWSGFGPGGPGDARDEGAAPTAGSTAADASPGRLRAVPDAGRRRSTPPRRTAETGGSAREQRQAERVAAASRASDDAMTARIEASEREDAAHRLVDDRTTALARAQHDLDAARTALAAARRDVRTASVREREAAAARRRAERPR